MPKDKAKHNIELATPIIAILQDERAQGPSMTKTLEAAVYWYALRLTERERALARAECAEWLQTGVAPEVNFADDIDRTLRGRRARLATPPAGVKKATGRK